MAGTALTFSCWPWQHWLSLKPQATALYVGKKALTWQRLNQDIAKVPLLPASKGDYVALVARNDYQTLLVMLSAWQQGLRTLLLNPAFADGLTRQILDHAGIRTVIDPMAITLDRSLTPSGICFDADRLLTLVLTSGSTGTPKAVTHTTSNHLASADGLFSLMPFGDKDCWLLSLPLFHVSGLAIVWRWLRKGATLKIADTKGDALMMALEGATHASLVPIQLQRLLRAERPRSLHSVLLGGAVIPQPLVDDAEQKGIRCWCGYGMTEMASTITAKRADGRFSVGKTLPNRELRLSADGEVLVGGKTRSPGYFIKGQLHPLADRWFATKDRGEWRDGELCILGRLDNMFICGGENVQPESIERVLSSFGGVEQVFILPQADPKWGSVPVAVIQGKVDEQAFLQKARVLLPPHQVPKNVLALPDGFGEGGIKLSRKVLAEWLSNQSAKVNKA
ncbi:o-succinylbenzoate--CoA ligase [Grimontia hollisae]|uniref:o-succinylbenzoate--CoA ligase n=1 Tax=Grimontia hollisae TaxID=673 RepID=UPI0023D9E519|nr:o-succinylbenzoate--CoA ligase [Grimontia hollisae]MDF2184162.1 o-succinylbenzoate--CoA ligase [Grimontia hollisae]